MPENEIIITLDNDDEILQTKETDRSSSPNASKNKRTRLTFPFGACRVCSDSATGIHYGIATCEGCKGFFKRSILRKEKYRCYFDNKCHINVTNRNRCKACRFRRCVDEGMSVDGVKMGRIPKLVKERALKELKEQQMKEEASLADPNDTHPRTTSCSSASDRSVENDDPNGMETDFIEYDHSPIQRQSDLSNSYTNDHLKKNLTSSDLNRANEQDNQSMVYRTKHSNYLPADFTMDECDGVNEQGTGLLNEEFFQHAKAVAKKCQMNQTNSFPMLNEDEMKLLQYMSWCANHIFIRRSKRMKQLVFRMNQMIDNNIKEYPGDRATLAEFYNSIRLSCEVCTRAAVVYIQELPGMKNLALNSLQKLIARRYFDWYLIKYHQLYNNDQCYILAPNGFQFTRHWLNELHGHELSDGMFHFSKCLRELNLTEKELALILPLHLCYDDTAIEDGQIIQMLRSCYRYALFVELCQTRGEKEAKIMCHRISQILELLIPLNDLYQRKTASRILDV